jgi:single-stranded-DNA-specific exonuclease
VSAFSVRELPAGRVEVLARTVGIHPVTARCLLARGVEEPEAARRFLEPRLGHLRPPVGLADLEVAVERIAAAVVGGQTIGVFGDYDVDGVTTAALLTSTLRAFGARVVPRVASRDAGYGFGVADAGRFADAGCHLILTGDCGTSDLAAIAAAGERAIDVVVIDHHTVPDGVDHPALALINPFRPDSSFPFPHFASVGLAFYVVQSVRSRLRALGHFAARPEPDLRSWLDLVAIGTIADLVPLTGENRILTRLGLRCLDLRVRPGLRALLRLAGVPADRELGEREVAWTIAPRLNAPGRLGDAAPALELLLCRDPDRAEGLAAAIEQANQERRVLQDQAYAEARAQIEASPPGACAVVAGDGWAPGVVGIVAARLVDELDRPVFVIAVDPATARGRGSGRTAGGVDLYRALARCSDHMVRFGGHAAAAGLTVEAASIDALREALDAAVAEQGEAGLDGGDLAHQWAPATVRLRRSIDLADAEIGPGALTLDLARELLALAPFGKANPALRLVARGLEVTAARAVGDGSHLKLELAAGEGPPVGGIGFGLAHRAPAPGDRIDVLFAPLLNRWRGTERAEMQLVDLEPAPIQAAARAAL